MDPIDAFRPASKAVAEAFGPKRTTRLGATDINGLGSCRVGRRDLLQVWCRVGARTVEPVEALPRTVPTCWNEPRVSADNALGPEV